MKTGVESLSAPTEVGRAMPRSRVRAVWVVVFFVLAVIASAFGVKAFHRAETPAANLAPSRAVGAPIKGVITEVLVQPGEQVRKGQLLAVLDFSRQQDILQTAENNVILAYEQTQQNSTPVALPTPPDLKGGFEKKAVTVVASKSIEVPTMLPNPNASKNLTAVAAAQQRVDDLQSQIKQGNSDLAALEDTLADESDAASGSQALITSINSVVQHTQAEKQKSASLLAQGVISARDAARSDMYASQAQGQLEGAKIRAAAAQAALGDTKRQMDALKAKIAKAQADLPEAQALLAEAKKHPNEPAQMYAMQAPKQEYKLVKLKGPITPALPPQPLQVNFVSPEDAQRRMETAEQQLENASHEMRAYCIYAPVAGKLTKVNARPGDIVKPQTQLFVIERDVR